MRSDLDGPPDAQHGGCPVEEGGWWGPALGGFAIGAIVGSAFARPYYAYPSYGYGYGYPAYSYASCLRLA
jgi:hypothetical protein